MRWVLGVDVVIEHGIFVIELVDYEAGIEPDNVAGDTVVNERSNYLALVAVLGDYFLSCGE